MYLRNAVFKTPKLLIIIYPLSPLNFFSSRHPILVDPSDPTRNIAAECNCWNDVATVALATLGKPIIKDVTPNPRWQ